MSAPPPARTRSDTGARPIEPTRFRCTCGRSVATPPGSDADLTRRCSRCRHRAIDRADLVEHHLV